MFGKSMGRWLLAGLIGLLAGLVQSAWAENNAPSPTVPSASGATGNIRIFAAASATNLIQDIAALYEKEKGVKVVASFAASSALAKQIEQGAPVDVYVSADLKWMDYLDGKDRIAPDSRRNLFGNRLVLIAPKGQAFPVKLEKGFDLPGAFRGRWCSCDPAVPIGQYAKQALTALGWWAALEPRLAAAPDVRSALAFVERGECAVGIVFETDANMSDPVEILGVFPADTHQPVVYPVALVRGTNPAARDFLDFLSSPAAVDMTVRHGFTPLPSP